MIKRKYTIALDSFRELLERLGGEFIDEAPGVYRYSLSGEDVYLEGNESVVSVSASSEIYKKIEKSMQPLLE